MGKMEIFIEGLRMSLDACSKVLFSENYLQYLRTAFQDGPETALHLALRNGHGNLHMLVTKFLDEAIAQGLIPPTNSSLEAEILLAQIQGDDLLKALLCREAPSEARIGNRINVALAGFSGRMSVNQCSWPFACPKQPMVPAT